MKIQFKGFGIEGTPVEVLALIQQNAIAEVAASTERDCGVKAKPTFDEPQPKEEIQYDLWDEDDNRTPAKHDWKKITIEFEENGRVWVDNYRSINDFIRQRNVRRASIYPYWKMEEVPRAKMIAKNMSRCYAKHNCHVRNISFCSKNNSHHFTEEELA